MAPLKALGWFATPDSSIHSMDYGVKSNSRTDDRPAVIPSAEQINFDYKNENKDDDFFPSLESEPIEAVVVGVENFAKSNTPLAIFLASALMVLIIFIFLKVKKVI